MSTRRPACAPPPKIWICGSGSSMASRPAEIAIQRHAGGRGGGVRGGHRHREHGVAAEARLAGRAVEFDQARGRARPGRRRPGRRPRGRSRRSRGRPRASRRSRRTPRRRRAGRAPRRCRWTRRPARWRGRRRRLPAGPRPPPSGGRGCPTRGGRARRRSRCRSCGQLLRPGLAHIAERLDRVREQRAVRCAAPGPCRARSVMYSTGDLPSTRARNSPGSRRAARASSAARRFPGDAARDRLRRARRSRRGSRRRRTASTGTSAAGG